MLSKKLGKQIATLINYLEVVTFIHYEAEFAGDAKKAKRWYIRIQQTIVELSDLGIPMATAKSAKEYLDNLDNM